MEQEFVFFDLETGGLDVATSPVIQLAAVAVSAADLETENGSFEVKIKFNPADANPDALAANNYSADIWERDAVSPERARALFTSFLRLHATVEMTSKRGKPYYLARLAGHNVSAFDCPFIKRWYKSADEFFLGHYQALDTYQLALWIGMTGPEPPSGAKYDLSSLLEQYGLERVGDAHEALSDVRAAIGVARALTKKAWSPVAY